MPFVPIACPSARLFHHRETTRRLPLGEIQPARQHVVGDCLRGARADIHVTDPGHRAVTECVVADDVMRATTDHDLPGISPSVSNTLFVTVIGLPLPSGDMIPSEFPWK